MQLGLQVPDFTWPDSPAEHRPDLRAGSRGTPTPAGLASLWVMDHFFQIRGVGPPEHEMLEGWTALALRRGGHRADHASARWSPA